MNALSYLAASGAVSIGGGTHWVAKQHKRTLVRTAQTLIDSGYPPDVALVAAAASCGVTLTPDNVAMERARVAAQRLDEYLEDGLLRTFNVQYARRRKAGETRMCYATAKARFNRALVRRLGASEGSKGLIEEALSI